MDEFLQKYFFKKSKLANLLLLILTIGVITLSYHTIPQQTQQQMHLDLNDPEPYQFLTWSYFHNTDDPGHLENNLMSLLSVGLILIILMPVKEFRLKFLFLLSFGPIILSLALFFYFSHYGGPPTLRGFSGINAALAALLPFQLIRFIEVRRGYNLEIHLDDFLVLGKYTPNLNITMFIVYLAISGLGLAVLGGYKNIIPNSILLLWFVWFALIFWELKSNALKNLKEAFLDGLVGVIGITILVVSVSSLFFGGNSAAHLAHFFGILIGFIVESRRIFPEIRVK